MTSIAGHLAACPPCHDEFTQTLRSQRESAPLRITLAPEYWLRHDHVVYEQLVELADNTLNATEREMLDVHLRVCDSCQEHVRSFLAVREQIDKETESSFVPIAPETTREKEPLFAWWRGLTWNPAYTAAVVLIGIALVIGVAVLLKRGIGSLEAGQTQPPQINIGSAKQTPTPENQAVNLQPTPAPAPSEQLPRRAPSPALTAKNQQGLKSLENAGVVAALNDERGKVTVDKAGNVTGLDEIPQNTRHEIGETLLAENIKAPAIQAELAGGPVVLRGPDNSPTFRLRSPARTVIISDRPSFEWEELAGATSYRVSVGDLKGHEIAKSEELPAGQTRWTPPTSLTRGDIYVWEVEARIDGKKVVSPGGSAPQMKFKILSVSSAQELDQLKKARSHLALGVFYAREGMVAEAEQELREVVRLNPSSKLARNLLRNFEPEPK
jgi:hypothetical protein